MPRYKIVNNVRSELTAEEEAELDARAEAADLDLNMVRGQRDGHLYRTDRTQSRPPTDFPSLGILEDRSRATHEHPRPEEMDLARRN